MGRQPVGVEVPGRPWGVLGGTFDPIHDAHLAIAEQTWETLDLAGVLFVPAGMPPHKSDQIVTQANHRVAMVELAIAGNPHFRLGRFEVDRPGPSYAVETMQVLNHQARTEHREEPVFIMSVDALRELNTWHDPRRLLDMCRVAVVPRRGYHALGRAWLSEQFPSQERRFQFLDGPDLGHSASDIRRRVAAGKSIRYLVPPPVAAYIAEHGLYPAGLWTKN